MQRAQSQLPNIAEVSPQRKGGPFYIEQMLVTGLWGKKNYDLKFHPDVNILIGPNASGKTTLINLLYDLLSGNILKLLHTEFRELSVSLRSFNSDDEEKVTVTQTADKVVLQIGDVSISAQLPVASIRSDYGTDYQDYLERRFSPRVAKAQEIMRCLVPAVWLPVSRRLPIAEEEDVARRRLHRRPLESVDECLSGLLDQLITYRTSLETQLSEYRKEFQRHALENILYDKQHEVVFHPDSFHLPTEADRKQFLKAFQDVGLVDPEIEQRITEHFDKARTAVRRFKTKPEVIDVELLFILPLINRTKAIVRFAQELQGHRENIFCALEKYITSINSFLSPKEVRVSDRGALLINTAAEEGVLHWRHLSSGEKQLLILLTQALLSEKNPVVYVADEPELSLHVVWQEKLMRTLSDLAGQCQFVVATHSPDITSGFGKKVIDLGRIAG